MTVPEERAHEQGPAALRGIRRQRAGDDAVTARVHSKVTMVVREPHRIKVRTVKGRVSLHGAAGADEVPHLLRLVAQVPGVTAVESALDVQEQDGGARAPGLFRAAKDNRGLLTGATGGALAVYGLRKRSLAGAGIAAVGLGLIVSGLNHQDVRRLLGLKERARRRAEEWGRSKQPEPAAKDAGMAPGRPGGQAAERRLRDIMTRDVEVLKPDVAVDTAADAMKRLDIGAIPVCDGRRMVGMLTDRDIVLRSVAEKRDAPTLVGDVMTTDVVYGFEDDLMEEAALKMVERRIRRLPVLNRDYELVGIVSLGDLAVHGMDTTLSGEVLEYISQPAQPRRHQSNSDAAP
jgi:CBS domain-containing protein